MRIVPEIAFFLDETEEKAQKIDDILSGLDIPSAQDEEKSEE